MRILCISDTHLAVMPSEYQDRVKALDLALKSRAFWPGVLNRMPQEEARDNWEKIGRGVNAAYDAVLDWAQNHEWDLAIHLGDVTQGWREAGMGHPLTLALARKCRSDLEGLADTRFCPGNHDTGYDTITTGEHSGMTFESLLLCQWALGKRLWWSQETPSGQLLIGVVAPLAKYEGKDAQIQVLRKAQEAFIAQELRRHRGPWMLFAHEMLTPKVLAPIIYPYMKDLKHFVYGDLHARWAGWTFSKLLRLSGMFKWSKETQVLGAAHSRAIFVPSVAPLWTSGHRLVALDVDERGIHATHIRLPMTPGAKQLPTRSAIRCAAWMLPVMVPNMLNRK